MLAPVYSDARPTRFATLANLLALALALCATAWTDAVAQAGSQPEPLKRVGFKAAPFDPLLESSPLPETLRRGPFRETESGIFVVQLSGEASAELRATVENAGGLFLDYIPPDAFIVRLPGAAIETIRQRPEVRFAGPLDPGHKISPELGVRPFKDSSRRIGGEMSIIVGLFEGGAPVDDVVASIEAAGADLVRDERDRLRLIVRATRDEAEAIAAITDVRYLSEVGEITYRNNASSWVVQTNVVDARSVWDQGLRGEGQIVGVMDSRMDMNSCYFSDGGNNTPGPDHRKVIAYRSSTGQGAASHGTHVAGTVAGNQFPVNGTNDNSGIAYEARISFENSSDVSGIGGGSSNFYDALSAAYADGARVHTNSWGDDGTTSYTPLVAAIDEFSYDFEESLVMFAVTNTSSLRAPENSKNVLAVGASRNGGSSDQFCSGGRGPTADGRTKPEIFAPGCSIVSARNSATCDTRSSTGTSMACPAVAGAATLVRQYFVDGFYPSGAASAADALTPSGALMKSVLLNSAVDMTALAGAPPNDDEGWGRLLLENALHFAGESRKLAVVADLRNADGLATGNVLEFPLEVLGDSETLKVTLVFTDPVGSVLAADPVVNDIDLVVEGPSGTFLGNVFDGSGHSAAGGSADPKNNVEQVVIPTPVAGSYTLRVSGARVNQGLQGFALVATGDVEPTTGPFLTYLASTFDDAAPNGNADGVLDPGETVVIPVDLKNAGLGDASAVVATMTSDRPDLLKITRNDASYADIPKGGTGSSAAPHYAATLEPAAACGDPITVTLATDSAEISGETSFQLDIGRRNSGASGPAVSFGKQGTFTSDASISDTLNVESVQVTVDIAHGDVGELIVELQSPTGTIVRLHDQSGAGTANLVGTYGGGLQPDGPGSLGDFSGEPAQGAWTLSVQDVTAGPTAAGDLNGWSLALRSDAAFDCNPLSCGAPAPGSVGNTLLVDKQPTSEILFSWGAVSGASGYRVWTSQSGDFTDETLEGESVSTDLTAGAAPATSGLTYYQVRALNSCNWEGP